MPTSSSRVEVVSHISLLALKSKGISGTPGRYRTNHWSSTVDS
ncbi:hypothetical protein LEMLEM_LOCUS20107 [Lemmus lemmus]